jgi:hypothetical protein
MIFQFIYTKVITLSTETWTQVKPNGPNPGARAYLKAAFTAPNYMIFFGGADARDDVVRYNMYTDEWVSIPATGAPSQGRDGHTNVIYDNTLIIFGGFFSDGSVEYLQIGCNDDWYCNQYDGNDCGRVCNVASGGTSILCSTKYSLVRIVCEDDDRAVNGTCPTDLFCDRIGHCSSTGNERV